MGKYAGQNLITVTARDVGWQLVGEFLLNPCLRRNRALHDNRFISGQAFDVAALIQDALISHHFGRRAGDPYPARRSAPG